LHCLLAIQLFASGRAANYDRERRQQVLMVTLRRRRAALVETLARPLHRAPRNKLLQALLGSALDRSPQTLGQPAPSASKSNLNSACSCGALTPLFWHPRQQFFFPFVSVLEYLDVLSRVNTRAGRWLSVKQALSTPHHLNAPSDASAHHNPPGCSSKSSKRGITSSRPSVRRKKGSLPLIVSA
jgi:hypothetical protein